MNTFVQHLNAPEYMHVLLNPVPVYGLAFGTFALVLALLLRNHRVTIAALVLVFVGAISAWPVYHYGEAGYDRVKAMSDPGGERWLDEHMVRGEKLIWTFYVLAAVSAVGIAVIAKWPRTSTPLAISALVLASGTLGIGGYIAYAGGHVRHKEFRFEPAPEARSEEHHHHDEHQHAEQKAASSPPEHVGHEQMQQPDGEQQKSEEERRQLEASRLQLEASRLQLEASRKQLEAAGGGSPKATSTASPGTSPTPPKEQSPHQHNDHSPQP